MIPDNTYYDDSEEGLEEFFVETQTSRTYAMLKKRDMFVGTCDRLEAVKQAVYKIVNTERYQYGIYSWDYGIELRDLIGMDIAYAMAEVKYRIMEALTQDDRIDAVENFEFEKTDRHTLHVKFTVISTEGTFDDGVEVGI